jgi:hypothetical protein
VVGSPPEKSPGLSNYPACDQEVKSLANTIWQTTTNPAVQTVQRYGKGKIIWGGVIPAYPQELYPSYAVTSALLRDMGVWEDFAADGSLRYTHRVTAGKDIYFVSNKTGKLVTTNCFFRTEKNAPELWDPLTGETRPLPEFMKRNGQTSISLQFEAWQSFFIVFKNDSNKTTSKEKTNFPSVRPVTTLTGSWAVSFDTVWGGPRNIIFDTLTDWKVRPEQGIKYYSGTATYKKTFGAGEIDTKDQRLYLDLGVVKNLARVKLNGKDLGVVWTAPWRVAIPDVLKKKGNLLEIEVANLWANRLIGDEALPDDGIKDEKWPEWLVKGEARTSGRFTFSTFKHYQQNAPLLPSGLLGPVTIQQYIF